MQNQKTSLTYEVNNLTKKKQNLEGFLKFDMFRLNPFLAQALVNLKKQKPELFYMTEQEKINQLVSVTGKVVSNLLDLSE